MNDVLDVCTLQQSACFMLRERIQIRNPLNLCQSHKLGLSFACRIAVRPVYTSHSRCLCQPRREFPISTVEQYYQLEPKRVTVAYWKLFSLCAVSSCHTVDVWNHQIHKLVSVHVLERPLSNSADCGALHSHEDEWKCLVDFNTTAPLTQPVFIF